MQGASKPAVAKSSPNPARKMDHSEKFVTYPKLTGFLIGLATVVMSCGWVAWQVHASTLHDGSVNHREFTRFREDVREASKEQKQELRHLRDKLDVMESKLDQIIARQKP